MEGRAVVISDKKAVQSYTHGWLNYMVDWAGMRDEDIELVSVCDIMDLPLLRAAKTRKLRIVGGPAVFSDAFYSMYADALVIGEGFQFFKDYKQHGLEWTLNQPYVLTPDKETVTPSTHVDWRLAPIIRTGKRKIMTLGGRGCKNKCKFCYTSWTTKYQNAPSVKIPSEYDGYVVNVITNDSEGDALSQNVAVRSITVKRYLEMTMEEAKRCHFYRFGLESFTEEGRKFFNKPISNAHLKAVAAIAKKLGHDIQFFVIAGLQPQESLIEFCNAIGYDMSKRPRIIIKGTYFEPCQHTPLEAFDIRKLHNWDVDWMYGKLTEYSGRYRTTMCADAGQAVYRGLIKRTTNLKDAEILWKARLKKRHEIDEIVKANNLEYLYYTVPPSRVRFDWRKNNVAINF